MLWSPLAFGAGCAVYLVLRSEPPLWLAVLLALAGVVAAILIQRSRAPLVWVVAVSLLAFVPAGFMAAKVRAMRVAAPVLTETRPYFIQGWVVDLASPGATGGRMVVAPVRISGIEPSRTPNRVRITLPADALASPGDPIQITAILGPPPPPAGPGAYDFARDAWFEGIGAVGFTRDRPEAAQLARPSPSLSLVLAINRTRWALAQDIARTVGPRAAGLAVAMTTGHEVFLQRETEDALRNSGLAHIISISGLHMAIVGGFVFFAIRFLIALVPPVALRINGKKAAAIAGLLAITGYLILSGAPSPAQRAAITAGVAFIAILFDRRAVTLHTLALAALLILMLQPDAVVDPGFQTSFAATAALVALAEAWVRPVREINTPWPIRLAQGAMTWFAIALGASIVAGLATGPIAMQNFNRVSVYGLGANLVSEPLSTFLIMPFLALGALGTPLGIGEPFLRVAGFGIEQLQAIAVWVSARPGAVWLVPSAPDYVLPIAVFGSLFICLWRGPLRWLGLPLALSVTLWPRPPAPDLWIADDGAAAVVRDGQQALMMRPIARVFAADLWSRRRGLTVVDGSSRFDCNRQRCLVDGATPVRVAGWWTRRMPTAAQQALLCRNAELVVLRATTALTAEACRGVRALSGADFQRGGAAELFRQGAGWRIVWAQDLRGDRPWTHRPPDGGRPVQRRSRTVSDSGG